MHLQGAAGRVGTHASNIVPEPLRDTTTGSGPQGGIVTSSPEHDKDKKKLEKAKEPDAKA